MGIISWIILGAIAGVIASWITKTNEGIVMDIILGVVGAVIGGLVMGLFGFPTVTELNLYSIAVSVLGAVILISLGKALSR